MHFLVEISFIATKDKVCEYAICQYIVFKKQISVGGGMSNDAQL